MVALRRPEDGAGCPLAAGLERVNSFSKSAGGETPQVNSRCGGLRVNSDSKGASRQWSPYGDQAIADLTSQRPIIIFEEVLQV